MLMHPKPYVCESSAIIVVIIIMIIVIEYNLHFIGSVLAFLLSNGNELYNIVLVPEQKTSTTPDVGNVCHNNKRNGRVK